jgi:long-chain acyl-CoA synthetase
VIGVPDDLMGEVPKAFLVLKEDAAQGLEEAFKEFLSGRIAPYKIPKHFEYRDSLPKNDAGKIQKTKLR